MATAHGPLISDLVTILHANNGDTLTFKFIIRHELPQSMDVNIAQVLIFNAPPNSTLDSAEEFLDSNPKILDVAFNGSDFQMNNTFRVQPANIRWTDVRYSLSKFANNTLFIVFRRFGTTAPFDLYIRDVGLFSGPCTP
jgi:hypothetical protein